MPTVKLPTVFATATEIFFQRKRGDKAALYSREVYGEFRIYYEAFAIKSKDGKEVYPNSKAMGVWAWCPVSLERAEYFFDRIEKGEIEIPNVDPITGEALPEQ